MNADNQMNLDALNDAGLSKKDAAQVYKHLSGRIGDIGRTDKFTYFEMIAKYDHDQVKAAIKAVTGNQPQPKLDEGNRLAAALQQPKQEPKMEEVKQEAAKVEHKIEAKKEDSTQAALELASLLQRVAGASVNAEQVTEIVRAELAKQQPQTVTITLKANGEQLAKLEEKTHTKFKRVLDFCSIRQNVLLVGPSGCGKTHLAAQIAKALNLSFGFISCSAGMSEAHLTGRLLPIEAGGKFSYVPSDFVEKYENGGVFLLDELDAADSNLLLVINAALANGHMAIPSRTDKPMAIKHADFVCMAAANSYGHGANRVYAGREQLDAATLERFRAGIVPVDYDQDLEKQLASQEVIAWAYPIRAKINELGLRRIMSTRVLRDFTTQQQLLGYGRQEWEESYFADWSKDELAKIGR